MFNFFQKRKYLIDYLDGLTDMHNHILPGIDDGAKNIEESIAMIREFASMGITNFIATPHIMNDYYDNNEKTIKNALNILKQKLKEDGLSQVTINAAAEYMMDSQYEQLVEKEKILCLKDNFVLLEISFFQAPLHLDEIIFKTFTQGYKPVLAHPERYSFFHSKFHNYQAIKNQAVPFQLNALSLTDHYGSSIQKTAYKLLEEGMIDFLGTDAHHLQHLLKIKEIKLTAKQLNLINPAIDNTKRTFGN